MRKLRAKFIRPLFVSILCGSLGVSNVDATPEKTDAGGSEPIAEADLTPLPKSLLPAGINSWLVPSDEEWRSVETIVLASKSVLFVGRGARGGIAVGHAKSGDPASVETLRYERATEELTPALVRTGRQIRLGQRASSIWRCDRDVLLNAIEVGETATSEAERVQTPKRLELVRLTAPTVRAQKNAVAGGFWFEWRSVVQPEGAVSSSNRDSSNDSADRTISEQVLAARPTALALGDKVALPVRYATAGEPLAFSALAAEKTLAPRAIELTLASGDLPNKVRVFFRTGLVGEADFSALQLKNTKSVRIGLDSAAPSDCVTVELHGRGNARIDALTIESELEQKSAAAVDWLSVNGARGHTRALLLLKHWPERFASVYAAATESRGAVAIAWLQSGGGADAFRAIVKSPPTKLSPHERKQLFDLLRSWARSEAALLYSLAIGGSVEPAHFALELIALNDEIEPLWAVIRADSAATWRRAGRILLKRLETTSSATKDGLLPLSNALAQLGDQLTADQNTRWLSIVNDYLESLALRDESPSSMATLVALEIAKQIAKLSSTQSDITGADPNAQLSTALAESVRFSNAIRLIRMLPHVPRLLQNSQDVIENPAVEASVAAVVTIAKSGSAPELRLEAVTALGKLQSEVAENAILAALGDSDPGVRSAAVGASFKIGAKKQRPLLSLAGDPWPMVRTAVVEALGKSCTHTPLLLTLSRKDSALEVRREATIASAACGGAEVTETLVAIAGDPNEEGALRITAVEQMGLTRIAPKTAALIELLRDALDVAFMSELAGQQSLALVRLLSLRCDADARSALTELTTAEDPTLASEAKRGLKRLCK